MGNYPADYSEGMCYSLTHFFFFFFFSSACSLHIYQIYDAGTVCAALLSFLSGMYGSGDSEELQWLAKRFSSGWTTPGIDWRALQGGEQLLRLHLFYKRPQLDAYQPGPLSASQQWWTQNQTFLQKKKTFLFACFTQKSRVLHMQSLWSERCTWRKSWRNSTPLCLRPKAYQIKATWSHSSPSFVMWLPRSSLLYKTAFFLSPLRSSCSPSSSSLLKIRRTLTYLVGICTVHKPHAYLTGMI